MIKIWRAILSKKKRKEKKQDCVNIVKLPTIMNIQADISTPESFCHL